MARRTGCPRASLRLDAGFLRFPRPFGDFAFDIVRELVRAHRRNIESHDSEARLDLRLGDAPVDGVVEPVDDVARRAGRRHQAVPQDRLEAGQLLGDRRNIGRERGAYERGHAEAFHLAAFDLREADREVREGERDLARQRVGDGERHALVRHVHGGEPSEGLELGDRHLRAGGPVARSQPAGRAPRAGDEFAKVLRRKIRAHHQHHRGRDQADDRSEVLRRIVLEVLEQRDVGRLRGVGRDEDGVAVGRAARHFGGAQGAERARAVLDDERLAEGFVKLLAQDAGDLVGPGSGGEGHDELHRMAGVILSRYRRSGACKNDRADGLQHAASGKTREGSVSGRFGLSQAAPPYNEVVQITIGRRGHGYRGALRARTRASEEDFRRQRRREAHANRWASSARRCSTSSTPGRRAVAPLRSLELAASMLIRITARRVTSRIGLSGLVLIFALAPFAVPETYAQDRQAANREIYLYRGADRAQRLVSRAKKEGGLSLYTTMTPEDATPMIAAFEQKYGIKVRMWRGINQKLVQRALAESRAGKSAVDVYEGS